MTFVDNATSYYGNNDTNEVTRETNKNFTTIKNYMHSKKLKVNSVKIHLLVIPKSKKGEMQGG